METRESYTSPDGALQLFVVRDDDDITLGFDGYSWHTHGDVLVGEYELQGESNLSPEAAIRRFVTDILENRAILALSRVQGQLQDVWVTHSPADEFTHALPNESIECRYWNGTVWGAKGGG